MTAATRKRDGSYAQLYSLCPKKKRTELFQFYIPDWIESKTKMKRDSDKSKLYDKSIFEWLVMDNKAWHTVNTPGFIRLQQVQCPTFELGSAKYYSDMLEPCYNRVKSGM